MNRSSRVCSAVAFLGLGLVALIAERGHAQQNPSGGSSAADNNPMGWQVDALMKHAVNQIARQYNLDEKQQEYTQKLMTQRVKGFLQNNERDLRILFSEWWDYQLGGQAPPPEAAKDFARRAGPLFAAMHQEIIDGNLKWREILNEEQRKLHDRDMDGIDKAFQQYDKQFERWARGEFQPGDFGSRVSSQPRPIMKSEDAWQYYVRHFIQDYRLDEGQQQSAYSALRRMREEAAAYRDAHKQDFAELDAKYNELAEAAPKTDPEELEKAKRARKELDGRRERLEKEISTNMFERLKKELDGIPRDDQRRAFQQRQTNIKEVEKRARAAFTARTQPAAASQPESQPAAADAQATPPKEGKAAE
ncbi:MAG: hypothetical protein KA354_24400 [Phycisphaerae bacterium]|nr:hypothetical protein [Phycisphaerae bacterium]